MELIKRTLDAAVLHFDRVERDDPEQNERDRLNALVTGAEKFLHDKQFHQVIEICHEGMATDARHPQLWLLKGQAHHALGQWGHAEICYRTASAYGCADATLADCLSEILTKQGAPVGRYPLRRSRFGNEADMAPGAPDISLLGGLVWQAASVSDHDVLSMLRDCGTLDEVLSSMVGDPRFGRANGAWLAMIRSGDL